MKHCRFMFAMNLPTTDAPATYTATATSHTTTDPTPTASY